MNRTKIEWTDYSINPIKGVCKKGCEYCYARQLYARFKWNPEVRFVPEELNKISKLREPSKIFLCSTHEVFGEWIPKKWIDTILTTIRENPQHTFQILTKNPKRPYLENIEFPNNCWIGITMDRNNEENWQRLFHLVHYDKGLHIQAKVKFISFEPLLENIEVDKFHYLKEINWIIIGSQTNPLKIPNTEWVLNIINQARWNDIPLFLKDNLGWEKKIQEFPE